MVNVQTERPQQVSSIRGNRKKDIAKFLSGFAANQVLVHGALALNSITFSLFGIQYTPTFNAFGAFGWAVITIFLMLYAWKRD